MCSTRDEADPAERRVERFVASSVRPSVLCDVARCLWGSRRGPLVRIPSNDTFASLPVAAVSGLAAGDFDARGDCRANIYAGEHT